MALPPPHKRVTAMLGQRGHVGLRAALVSTALRDCSRDSSVIASRRPGLRASVPGTWRHLPATVGSQRVPPLHGTLGKRLRAKEESCIPALQAKSSTASALVHPILISFKKLLERGRKFQDKVRSKAFGVGAVKPQTWLS